MNLIMTQIRRAVELFKTDSLFRNAAFLMASTAIMSALGFGFWFFVAHLYAPSDIGVASALISITLLASNLSFFGLNSGLVRFLPTSKTRSQDINASIILVALASMAAAVAYLLWVGDDLPGKLGAFTVTPFGYGQILFILLMAVVSLNTFTDSVFIASRRAEFHTTVYAVFGVVKLIAPLFLVSRGSLGIFAAYVLAAGASLILSLYFMWRYCDYNPLAKPNWGFIKKSRQYASNNYFAALLSGLPSQIMPSLIIKGLGAADAAFFSMAWTMANLLYVIPSAITNSLMAETSHDVSRQAQNVRRAVGILAVSVTPAVVIALVVAPALLSLFGHQYSANGTLVFQLLAFATFFMAANSVGNAIMNIERRSRGVLWVQLAIAATTIALAFPLMRFGLVGIGLSFILGSVAGNGVQLLLLARKRPAEQLTDTETMANLALPSWSAVRKLVKQYGLSTPRIGREIGWSDHSHTILVTSGTHQYVIKIYNQNVRSREQLLEELAFIRFLKKRGLPVPTFVGPRAGLVSEVTASGQTWLAIMSRYEAGTHPTTYSPALLADIARVQGQIHEAGMAFATSQKQLSGQLERPSLRSSLLPSMPTGVSHFDYDGSNILVKGDQVSCVVDFESMRQDPFVVDIFFTLTCLYDLLRDKSKLETYLRSYETVRKLGWLEKPVLRLVLAMRYHSPKLLLLSY